MKNELREETRDDLIGWLDRNKITYRLADSKDDVIDIIGFGKSFIEDTEALNSIFKVTNDENGKQVMFNLTENEVELIEEGVSHVLFKFGNNWYYHNLGNDFKLNILKYVGERKKGKLNDRFVNLGVHTPYELLNGSFSLADWVRKAKYLRNDALGICDMNTMAGALTLQKECDTAGIKPVIGYSLEFTDGDERIGAKVYCKTNEGLRNLLRIQKAINVDSDECTISMESLIDYGYGNFLVFDKRSSFWLSKQEERQIDRFFQTFEDCFYQLDLSEYKADRIDSITLEATKKYFDDMYWDMGIPPILLSDCYYLDKDDARNKILLNKIASGAAHDQSDDQYFKDLDEQWETIEPLFDKDRWDVDFIFDRARENALEIADAAEARFEMDRNFMPQYDMTEEEKLMYKDRHDMFLTLLEDGFKRLVPKDKEKEYRERLDKEIYILESTNNVDYMLVQYDTVNYARRNGILVGCGRGSAGGSLVLYLLGITLVDPIRYDLIFERFLLPERAGLYPAMTTIISNDIDASEYMEVGLDNGRTYKICHDAQMLVKREGGDEPVRIFADELMEDDDILFDNRDGLFTINEI